MSKVTMGQILAETEAFIKQSSAQFKKTAGYAPASTAGGDGSDIPGAECLKPVSEKAKKSQPEVAEGLPAGMVAENPKGGTNESPEALDATQSAKKNDKNPMVGSDANAEPKTGAAKIANDLLASIREYQTKFAAQTQAAEQDPKKAEEAQVGLELTADVLAKIASIILSTEDGVKFAEAELTKVAGAEAAQETFNFLQKQAAYAQGQADAEAYVSQLVAQDNMQKQAEYAQGAADAEALITGLVNQDNMQKQAEYAQGAADAEALITGLATAAQAPAVKKASANKLKQLKKLAQEIAEETGEELGEEPTGEEGLTPEDAAAAAAEMGSVAPDEDITPEDLEQALVELVQEGAITPEDAQNVVQAIAQAVDAEAADESTEAVEGDEEPMAGGEEVPVPEDISEEAGADEALGMKAAALVEAIQNRKKEAAAGKK